MTQDFYDKVATKFGNYQTPARYVREYINGEPEKIFKDKLLGVSGKSKLALDVGCADGRFTLSMANNFKEIIAIDTSREMLLASKRNKNDLGITNVSFLNEDVHAISFPDNHFDVIYSRRGPNDYSSYNKILKKGGYFLGIDIGEKDTQEIKEVFGRGQNYGSWNKSILSKNEKSLKNAGFKITYAEGFQYNEYYSTPEDLDVFMQGVPIFEDYNSGKDKKYLDEYIKRNQSKKGINLPRHRVVMVAVKT